MLQVSRFLFALTFLVRLSFAQTPSAATSTVFVSPPVVPSSGTSTITVQLKEANGANITSGGATVSFVTPSLGSIGTSVVDNNDGTYTAVYTAGMTTGNVSIIPVVNSTNFSNTTQVTVGSSYILDGTSGNNTEIHSFSTDGNISIGQGFFVDYLIVGGGTRRSGIEQYQQRTSRLGVWWPGAPQ